MTAIQRPWRFLTSLIGRHTGRRSVIFLLVLIVILPALSGAQQACQPDGDVDQSGSVTAADALLAFQQALSVVQLDTCQQTIADVFPQPGTPDANITASDALCIFQKALSLPSCLDTLTVDIERFVSVDTGWSHTCGIRDTGVVECWGDDDSGQSTPPAGMFVSVDTGWFHTCGIRDTDVVECWGDDDFGQSTPPAGTFVSVSSGGFHSCGIRDTDVVECWGGGDPGQSTPPAGTFVSVNSGGFHSCGIRDTGVVECWGDDDSGQSTPPAGTFVSVSSGGFYSCGIRDTGVVECWGDDDSGQSTPPAGTFVSVDTGWLHTCGIRDTDVVECWGDDDFGQSTPPAGTFVSVSSDGFHSCGIRDTGAVECWGGDDPGTPAANGSVPKQNLTLGGSVALKVSPYFTDPDGDPLTYYAQSGDIGIVAVEVSGDNVTLRAQDTGTTAVTVTATDPDGLSVIQEFNVQVNVVFVVGVEAISPGPDGLIAVGRDVTWVSPAPNVDGFNEGWNYRTNINGDKDGLQVYVSGTDLTVEYWNNGVIQSTASYRDGKPYGSFKRYAYGQLDGIQYMITGEDWSFESYRAGTLHGPYGKYVNGAPEGTFGSFSNGELAHIQYTITGGRWSFESYRAGTLHGPYGAYNSDGHKHGAFGIYLTGSKAGEVTYDNGESETASENNPPLPIPSSVPKEITMHTIVDEVSFASNWFFLDPDGESLDLVYFVSSEPPGMFNTFPDGSVIGSSVSLDSGVMPGSNGHAMVTACDPGGLCAQVEFEVIVQPEFTRIDPRHASVETLYCKHPLVEVAYPTIEAEICARDLMCEDGDGVHLELFIDNSWRSFDFPSLSNQFSCQTVQVQGKTVDIPYRMEATSKKVGWWDWDTKEPLCRLGCSPDCFVGPELYSHPGSEENWGQLTIRTLVDSETRQWKWRDDRAWSSEGTFRVEAVAYESEDCSAENEGVLPGLPNDACMFSGDFVPVALPGGYKAVGYEVTQVPSFPNLPTWVDLYPSLNPPHWWPENSTYYPIANSKDDNQGFDVFYYPAYGSLFLEQYSNDGGLNLVSRCSFYEKEEFSEGLYGNDPITRIEYGDGHADVFKFETFDDTVLMHDPDDFYVNESPSSFITYYSRNSLHGPSGMYLDGSPLWFANYVHGKKEGVEYYRSGLFFAGERNFSPPELTTNWRFYTYRAGVKHGPFGTYNSEGKPFGIFGIYKNGSLDQERRLSPDDPVPPEWRPR